MTSSLLLSLLPLLNAANASTVVGELQEIISYMRAYERAYGMEKAAPLPAAAAATATEEEEFAAAAAAAVEKEAKAANVDEYASYRARG
jgi:valyl-tRNA synthetase